MLRRPRPGLVWRAQSLGRAARALHARLLRAAARLRFGALVVGPEALERRLLRAARAAPLAERLLLPIVTANLEAHGAPAVDDAADRALGQLATAEPRARAALARALATAHAHTGGLERPLALLESVAAAPGRLGALRRQVDLLRHGVPFGEPLRRDWEPVPGRVLYYANQTLPHHGSGYAIRTHWLARTLRDLGWDLTVRARLGYPNDRWDFLGVDAVAPALEIETVPYRFTPSTLRGRGVVEYQRAAVETLVRDCGTDRPAILHAASNYTGGLAVTEAARRLGIPSVYEVRGLWHLTRAAEQPAYLDSDHYRMIERLEVQAAASADHVFAITRAVAEVLERGGVPASKITLLPNAVDATRFAPRPPDPALAERWQLRGRTTIGYVGAFHHYEGLDLLLQAAALLRRRLGDRFAVLLVGDGPAGAELRALSARLGLAELVRFTGRVPPEVTPDHYALVDVVAFPRKALRVCEVVSPIKPFEAMASGAAVVVSDVRALSEIVRHGETGLVHRADDVESLAAELERLITDPALRRALADRGRDWVVERRTWTRVCARIDRVYRELTT